MIHLLDATTLLALNQVQGTYSLLGITEVLDVVLEECNHPDHFDSALFLQKTGLTTIETLPSWLQNAKAYRLFELSSQDSLNLYYAKSAQRTLITASCVLQGFCKREAIDMQPCSLWLQQVC